MVVLTILLAGFVHPAWSADATGATAISLSERFGAPSAPFTLSSAAVAAQPLAYGLPELSAGRLSAAWLGGDLCAALEGSAGGGWMDLGLLAAVRLPITRQFNVGLGGSIVHQGATGFATVTEGTLSIQARIILDPTWSVVCSMDNVLQFHTRFQPPSGTLRLGAAWEGAVTASAVASIGAAGAPDLHVSMLTALTDDVGVRARFGTAPMRVAGAIRLFVPELTSVAVDVEWVASLGVRTTWTVDLPS